jgi:hypothetical protein
MFAISAGGAAPWLAFSLLRHKRPVRVSQLPNGKRRYGCRIIFKSWDTVVLVPRARHAAQDLLDPDGL